jgi:hypothetical protein
MNLLNDTFALPTLGRGGFRWMDKPSASAGRSRRAMLAIRRKILKKLRHRIERDMAAI